MTVLAEAFRKFKAAERAAVAYGNDDLTPAALQQERSRRLAAAREELRKVAPQADRQGFDEVKRKRQEAIDGLAPSNADAVALIGNEWTKVEAMLNAGHNLAQMIEKASPLRITAILDQMPTRLIMTSEEPDDALAEVTGLALERLAALGNPAAQAAGELYKAAVHDSAWAQIIDQAATPFTDVSVTALTALYSASPDDHDAVSDSLEFDAVVQNGVRQADASPAAPSAV
ncbi:hypothetical protein [Frigoribacterium sp. NPDC087798]|uniref:hypothetical protein n=1 Tax=Frigoribacterium sp. NPDC087798 TaxID=3363993 RepID=UPI0037F94A12